MNSAHKNYAIALAKNIFQDKNKYLILDTETTGIGKKDVIIQIAIINLEGDVLFNQLIRPSKKKRIPTESTNIHGIKMSDLKYASTFGEIVEDIYRHVKNKVVIIYNKDFDIRLIEQTCLEDNVRVLTFDSVCAMKYYSEFVGQWSEYHSDYRYQKLEGGNHTALGDCLAVLQIFRKMADSEFLTDKNGKIIKPKENVEKTSMLMDIIGNPTGCVFIVLIFLMILLFFVYNIIF